MLRSTMLQVDKASLESLTAWYQKIFGMSIARSCDTDSALGALLRRSYLYSFKEKQPLLDCFLRVTVC